MQIERVALSATRAAGCALALLITACSGQAGPSAGSDNASAPQGTHATSLDARYADPKVGDLYSAELTHFSAYDFGTGATAYGMMRVIEVNDTTIGLYTETGAWPEAKGAIQELRGNLAGIEWHDGEKIQIARNELAQLVADKKILDVRRD